MGNVIADKVITNGKVYTVDDKDTVASAVAIKGKNIVYVGNDQDVKSYIGGNTEIIDVKGGAVFPGFIDSHMHPAIGAVPYLYEISLIGLLTQEEHLNAVREFIENNPDLKAYSGLGFNPSAYSAEGPNKKLLDEICSDKPIMLTSDGGHCMWVNSKALELCNITKYTVDPEGGSVQRDKVTGEPTGFLNGVPAIDLVSEIVPTYTKQQYKDAIIWLQEWFNKEGLTAIYDAYLDCKDENINNAYKELAEEEKLTMRIRGGWHVYPSLGTDEDIEKYMDKAVEFSKSLNTPYFKTNSFKFLMDGVIDEHTAYMIDPYLDREDKYAGECIWEYERMKKAFAKSDKEKFQIHVHQIGDAAARDALDGIEYAYEQNGRRDGRHTFAHVQCIREEDMDRMAKLDVHASMAPYWLANDPHYYFDNFIPKVGKYWADNMYRMKTLMDKGVSVSANSDFYVTEPNIGEMLYSGVTRNYSQNIFDLYYDRNEYVRTLNDEEPSMNRISQLPPFDEKLDLNTVVRMSTINGAKAHFLDEETGSIEEGKYADLVIYDKDLLNIDLEEVPNQKPLMTIFDGKIVFQG